ncbi:uncharacterized protein LOC119590833 isoform X2 [Penaeus monodon]|uniref:uncharacterized protein LOC119590833 isoform X2 n=1 Tax=Penaeus monodon TaxID=6687 RepID=UPI0018A78E8E|nr:uncharacterized protein LOC119590833 isoform X2 [Penaeus monodon]
MEDDSRVTDSGTQLIVTEDESRRRVGCSFPRRRCGIQDMPRAGFHALLLLSLVSLGRDAYGRKPEGLLGREHTRGQEKAAVETPPSAGREDVLSPQEPGSWAPMRRKRSPGTHGQAGPTPAQVPLTSHSAPHLPVFMASEFPRPPDGVDGLYSPPMPTFPVPALLAFLPCTGRCERRNQNGGCDTSVLCLFGDEIIVWWNKGENDFMCLCNVLCRKSFE